MKNSFWKKFTATVLSVLFVGTAFAGDITGYQTIWKSGGETIAVSSWCTGEYVEHFKGIHDYTVSQIMLSYPKDPPHQNQKAVSGGEDSNRHVFEQRMFGERKP